MGLPRLRRRPSKPAPRSEPRSPAPPAFTRPTICLSRTSSSSVPAGGSEWAGHPRAPPRKWAGRARPITVPTASLPVVLRRRPVLTLYLAQDGGAATQRDPPQRGEQPRGVERPCPRRAGRRASEGGPAVGGGDSSAGRLGRAGVGVGGSRLGPVGGAARRRAGPGRAASRVLSVRFLFCGRGSGAGRGRGPSSRLRPGRLAAVVRRRGLGGRLASFGPRGP